MRGEFEIMMIGRLEIVRGFYTKRRWWRYLYPKRLTIKSDPAVYCWLGFNFGREHTVLLNHNQKE